MKKILPKHLIDFSTEEGFAFGICCEECGRIWRSRKIRFSKAGIIPETEGKKIIYGVLYQQEWEKAKHDTCLDGKEHFSICPICHRLVCDSCFMICDDLDMCRRCAENLKAEGELVYLSDYQKEG